MNSIDQVREFHRAFGQPVNDEPNVYDENLNKLRVSLLDEEVAELDAALVNGNPVDVLDALADIEYVLMGAYLALGFHRYRHAALAEVHRSNMAKLQNGVVIRRPSDGKILKPDGWTPPDLKRVLEAGAKRTACRCSPANRCGRCDDVDALFDGTDLEAV